MSVITDTWRQLVGRRLWPVAAGRSLAALVAVPVLLAKDPAPAPPRPGGAGRRTGPRRTPSRSWRWPRRRGGAPPARARRRQGPVRAVHAAARSSPPTRPPPAAARTPAASAAQPGTSGGGRREARRRPRRQHASGERTRPIPGRPPVGVAPKQSLPPVHADRPLRRQHVRGRSSREQGQAARGAARAPTSPCSSTSASREDGKRAVFMVDANIAVQGDGVCKPNPPSRARPCTSRGRHRVPRRRGDRDDRQCRGAARRAVPARPGRHQSPQDDGTAKKAERSRARVSKAGRRVLRSHIARKGPLRYRYDARSGTVRRLGGKAYKAEVAKAARAIRTHFEALQGTCSSGGPRARRHALPHRIAGVPLRVITAGNPTGRASPAWSRDCPRA